MKLHVVNAALAAQCLLPLTACTATHGAPYRAEIFSERVADGVLTLAVGETVLLEPRAFDEAGDSAPLDRICVSWESSDAYAMPLTVLSPSAAVTARAGWFDRVPEGFADDDAGVPPDSGSGAAVPDEPDEEDRPRYEREPESVVTLDVCGTTATLKVRSVLSIAGTWQITIGTSIIQTIKLEQSGRDVTYVPTDGVAVPVGQVQGDQLHLTMMGFTLNGRLLSPTAAEGTVLELPGMSGTWTAVKHTTPTP